MIGHHDRVGVLGASLLDLTNDLTDAGVIAGYTTRGGNRIQAKTQGGSGGPNWTVGGDPSVLSMAGSAKIRAIGTTMGASEYRTIPVTLPATAWTIAIVMWPLVAGVGVAAAGICESPGNSTYDRSALINAAYNAYLFDGGAKTAVAPGSAPAIKVPAAIVCRTDGASLVCDQDGIIGSGVSVANSGYTGYATPEFCLGYANNHPYGGVVGIAICAFIPRMWSDAESLYWTRNAWSLCTQPRRIYVRVPSVAGGANPKGWFGLALNGPMRRAVA